MIADNKNLKPLPTGRNRARKGLLIIVTLWLAIGFLSFAGAAEAVNLTINNPGSGSGYLEIWVNGIYAAWTRLYPGDSDLIWWLNPGDQIEMKNEAPDARFVFAGYSQNNFTMPDTDKSITARFEIPSCSTATVLALNSTVIGSIDTNGDEDFYQFVIPDPGGVITVYTKYTADRTDTYGYLLDAGCNEI